MADNDCESADNSTLSSVSSNQQFSRPGSQNHHHHHHRHHRGHHHRPRMHQVVNSSDAVYTCRSKICEHSHPRKGVSIATQVISPSAIGGSLKFGHGRAFCDSYYPDMDTDDMGLFQRRKKVPWRKIGCYTLFIWVIIVLLAGKVLTEKKC